MDLYISTYGSKVGVARGKVVIENSVDKIEYPFESVDSLSIFPGVNISQSAIQSFEANKVPIFWMSKIGSTYAFINSPKYIDVKRQKMQFILSDDEKFSVEMSKRFIAAKINNQQSFLMKCFKKFGIKEKPDSFSELKNMIKKLKTLKTIEEIEGAEGYAAKVYFSLLKMFIPAEFGFEKRIKNPPEDPFNALLSLLYSLLYNNITSAIQNAGLCPYVAFMHKLDKGHCTLASDMMEEFRADVCDSIAVELINSKLSIEDFDFNEDGSVYLSRKGLSIVVDAFERKIKETVRLKTKIGEGLDYKALFSIQVHELIVAMEKHEFLEYRPIAS